MSGFFGNGCSEICGFDLDYDRSYQWQLGTKIVATAVA